MAPKKNYTPEQMTAALEAVRRGVAVASAAKQFNVPRVTLLYKSTGKSPLECSMGPPTILSTAEENILIQWIFELAKLHYPISKLQLIDSVEQIIKETKRKNNFTDGRPGDKWYKLFLRRHPELSVRIAQNLTTSREKVTEAQIRNWFEEIKAYMIEKNLYEITNQPERIFNADEAAFFLQPKGDRVLVKKGERNVYSAGNNDEKENLTVLVTANAAGRIAPPMVLFSYERIPSYISSSIPTTWGIGRSESGWMCGATFYEYITNVFVPWVLKENIPRPILLFIDGHVSHMTLHLSRFCSSNGIELFALYPNSTHLLQPMDVAVFRPLKNAWKKEVRNWRMENSGKKLQKQNFAPVFEKALIVVTEETLANGFRKCGLCPLNVENVSFEKISTRNLMNVQKNQELKTYGFLKELEKKIGNEKIVRFRQSINKERWHGDVEDTSLFKIWKDVQEANIREIATQNETENFIGNRKEHNNQEEVTDKEKNNDHVDLPNKITSKMCDNGKNLMQTQDIHQPSCSKNVEQCLETPLKNTESQQFCDLTNNSSANLPLDVPSPFKRALFWPEEIKSNKKRKTKEKIPSVITSDAWQEYHLKKETDKKRKEEEKVQRMKAREQKKIQKNTAKVPLIDKIESECSEEEWSESGDSLEDITISEEKEFCELYGGTEISIGDYVLVKFLGGKRNATHYRYVCVVQNILQEENEVEVMSLKVQNEKKDLFKIDECDISVVAASAILGKLPSPEIKMIGDRMKYKFTKPVDVFESS